MSTISDSRDWVAELRADGEARDRSLEELRTYLLRGLKKAYSGKGVDDAFCDDIAQEALVKILDKLDQFQGRSRFTTWAMTIAIRLAVSEFRRRRFKDVSLDSIVGDGALQIEMTADNTPTPQLQEEKKTILTTLKDLIENQLSEKQRIAVQSLLVGMPVEEIAARTGSNRNAVYKLFHDARARLRSGMEQRGFTWSDIQSAF